MTFFRMAVPSRLAYWIGCVLVLFSCAQVYADAETLTPSETNSCALQLFRSILKHDTVYPRPILPEEIKISLDKEESKSFFKIHAALWNQGFDRKEAVQIISKIKAGQALTSVEENRLKSLRARLKQLRSAFYAFDKSHVAPSQIDELATVLGHLQDAVTNKLPNDVQIESENSLKSLSQKSIKKLNQEIIHFKPSNRASFEAWVLKQAEALETTLAQTDISPEEFHEMRKVVSRLLAVFEVSEIVTPNAASEATIQVLSTLNGQMGDFHDKLITGKLENRLDYKHGKVIVPPKVRSLLEKVAERFSSSSEARH